MRSADSIKARLRNLAKKENNPLQGIEFENVLTGIRAFLLPSACGYKEGDIITCEGLNTPNQPFCGGAYAIIFPMQTALNSGATFNFEENSYCKTKLSCPDNGYVIFKITLVKE